MVINGISPARIKRLVARLPVDGATERECEIAAKVERLLRELHTKGYPPSMAGPAAERLIRKEAVL